MSLLFLTRPVSGWEMVRGQSDCAHSGRQPRFAGEARKGDALQVEPVGDRDGRGRETASAHGAGARYWLGL